MNDFGGGGGGGGKNIIKNWVGVLYPIRKKKKIKEMRQQILKR